MMKPCPECGSTEIVEDLPVFSDPLLGGQQPPYVQLAEPKPEKTPFLWSPKTVTTGFLAAICGSCGYTRFYSKNYAAILEAHKNGYKSRPRGLDVLEDDGSA
jgi:predicted nucleic-acid-binding Zn-ribbon protein